MTANELKRFWKNEALSVFERSPDGYVCIMDLMADLSDENFAEIKEMIIESLNLPADPVGRRKAAMLVWDELKEKASKAYTEQINDLFLKLDEDPWAIIYIKGIFKILASEQNRKDIFDSSYIMERG